MSSAEGRPRRPRLLPYLAVVGFADFGHAALLFGLLQARALEVTATSARVVGVGVALFLLMAFGLRAPAAGLLRRLGPRPLLVYSLAGSALTFALIGAAKSVLLLLVALALHGAAAAPLWPAALAGAVGVAGERGPRSLLERTLLAEIVAVALGLVAIGLLLEGGAGLAVAVLMSVWILGVLAAVASLPEAPLPVATASAVFGETDAVPAWRRRADCVRLTACALLVGGAFGALVAAAPRWAETVARLSPTHLAAVAAVGGGAALVAFFLSRRVGRANREAVALVVGWLAVALAAAAAPWLHGPWGAVPAAVLAGAGAALALRSWTAATLGPQPSFGWAQARLTAASLEGLGMAAGAALSAVLWQAAGPAACHLPAALLAVAAGLQGAAAWRARRHPSAM